MKVFDVIIIGAGPAGCAAAYNLAKNGISTAVLEQKKEIGVPICCGEAISERVLKQSGFYDDSYIDSKVKGFRVYMPNMKYFFVDTPGFLVNRDKFDKYIASFAEKAGAKIFLRTKASAIKYSGKDFEIESGGDVFKSKILIGADGPESLVDRTFFKNKYLLTPAFQYKLAKNSINFIADGYLAFYYDSQSDYYMWVFEKSRELNVGGGCASKSNLDSFISRLFGRISGKPLAFVHGYIPVSGIKKTVYKHKALLIGDAGGLVNPASLAGIYPALVSAREAASVIVEYFRTGREKSLRKYENRLRKYSFANSTFLNEAKSCYKYPEKILNLIGDYFVSDSFLKKDHKAFFKVSSKNPVLLKYIPRLLSHKNVFKHHRFELW